MIHHLVAAGHIVVACGGGGPPVYDDPELRLEGLDAVADKDRVAAILGREIAADVLLILTNVDAVYHAYGTPQQKAIRRLNLAQADHLLAGKELGTGSMRPKVEAARTSSARAEARDGRSRRHHRRAGAGPRGVAGRRRYHHHEGLSVNLHEYQARDILRRHGIPVPPGEVATTNEEARAIAARFGGPVVVKAQVHAGGRGKAGGVKLAANAGEAAAHAAKILGMTIKGLMVRRVLVAPAATSPLRVTWASSSTGPRSGPC